MRLYNRTVAGLALVATATFAACDDDPTSPGIENEQELITQVELTLTPVGGGAAIVTSITDPDGLGPLPPQGQVNPISLMPGTTYEGSVRFLDTSDPADVEDITVEVRTEDDEHRVFYFLSGVAGVDIPLASLDTDGAGAPLGLSFQIVVDGGAAGAGGLQVVLSHYDDDPKGDGLTRSDETDVDVTFDISVM
jgi:hypothetical protein